MVSCLLDFQDFVCMELSCSRSVSRWCIGIASGTRVNNDSKYDYRYNIFRLAMKMCPSLVSVGDRFSFHALECPCSLHKFPSESTACFVLETIRTGAMRVIHIPVKTEETHRLRIKFVLYCPICALNLKNQTS